jgi:hypothetical protein
VNSDYRNGRNKEMRKTTDSLGLKALTTMEIRNWHIVTTERKEWRSTVMEAMVHRGM